MPIKKTIIGFDYSSLIFLIWDIKNRKNGADSDNGKEKRKINAQKAALVRALREKAFLFSGGGVWVPFPHENKKESRVNRGFLFWILLDVKAIIFCLKEVMMACRAHKAGGKIKDKGTGNIKAKI